MKTKTHVKADSTLNHNQTLVRAPQPPPTLKVKTRVKAGSGLNHNQTLVRARAL